MKEIPLTLLLSAIALAALPLSLSATPVSWSGAQNISGNSDVSTAGTLVQAANIGSYNDTSVNGVPFAAFTTSSDGHFNLAGVSGIFSGYGSANAPFSNLSSEYQSLLTTGNFGSNASLMTLTISGLNAGDTYQFQVWINDSRGTYGQQGITVMDGAMSIHLLGDVTGMNGGTGQYALLTFTADSNGIETITFQGDYGNGTTEEAFQLRNITGMRPVPEGGTTLSLLAISILGLGVVRRKVLA